VSDALLHVEALRAGYTPDAPVVSGVSLSAARGEIVAVLGPNGAGKSTFVKAIAGLVPISTGRVRLAGEDITALPAHTLIRRGLAFVPQTENVFATLSVHDNLLIGAQGLPAAQRKPQIAKIYALFADLGRQRLLPAGRLSGGQRQMLAVGRALLVAPKVLLLDEPSAGLAPKVVTELFEHLQLIRASGLAIVLVEQNVRAALRIADRIEVLVEGRNRYSGTPSGLAADSALAALFLGVAAGGAPTGASP
jgi:branched-chain amino acid transport system ATP-binding protein